MNIVAMSLLALGSLAYAARSDQAPPVDLTGRWGSTVDVGKFKIRLVVKVTRGADGKISGKIDIPDQGARDIPVNAMLYNYPAVRWEIDAFDNTAINGTVSADGNEIIGNIEEGPGGRPISVILKKIAASPSDEDLVYTFAAGEARDLRGYWKGLVPTDRGSTNRVGLKIGRSKDGSYGVLLDLLDVGAVDLSPSSATSTNSSTRCEWQIFRVNFEGKLNEAGDRLAGTWQQGGKSVPVSFERLAHPAKVLSDDLSFKPDPQRPDDLRGEWKGLLELPDNNKLHIVFKIGTTPDGTIGGTLTSPDQGPREIPMSSGSFTNQHAQFEWKMINGVFKGTLTNNGEVLDGKWEQMGPGLKLRMERTTNSPANL